ncbi:hypothetical protein [Mucilaginibacter ginsenosidivorax]|uniref:hypothetical protein n=1 Tax=Mucilaginibacter ginsenosidivorax TaxID=862126 RepID=UPI002938E720|nr:hypothetical protein [Mucilaginibacter ginsenosidivorax]
MSNPQLFKFKTITEYHRAAGLPKPAHPQISVIHMEDMKRPLIEGPYRIIYYFYSIAMKRMPGVKFKYGQQASDFDEGVLFFMAPGQVFGVELEKGAVHRPEGWMILIHPDFLWNTPLPKTIRQY